MENPISNYLIGVGVTLTVKAITGLASWIKSGELARLLTRLKRRLHRPHRKPMNPKPQLQT